MRTESAKEIRRVASGDMSAGIWILRLSMGKKGRVQSGKVLRCSAHHGAPPRIRRAAYEVNRSGCCRRLTWRGRMGMERRRFSNDRR